MKFFVTFSGHNKQLPVISYTCHTHGSFSDSSHKQCVSPLDIFGTEPILHRRGLQRTNVNSIIIRYQIHPYFCSGPEETPNSLDKVIGGFTSFLPVFTTSFRDLLFRPERGSLFAVLLLLHNMFLAKGHMTG